MLFLFSKVIKELHIRLKRHCFRVILVVMLVLIHNIFNLLEDIKPAAQLYHELFVNLFLEGIHQNIKSEVLSIQLIFFF